MTCKTLLAYRTASAVDCFINGTLLTKSLSATWAQGNAGGLDVGSSPTQDVHGHLITDGTDTDVLFSEAPISPVVPSGWTLTGQVAGSLLIDASHAIRPFYQVGNEFYIINGTTDVNYTTNAGDMLRTVSVPMGVKVQYIYFGEYYHTTTAAWVYMGDPDRGAPGGRSNFRVGRRNAGNNPLGVEGRVWTNASKQIYTGDTSGSLLILTGKGWLDPRVSVNGF